MATGEWYVLKMADREVHGPTSLESLRSWASEAKISPLDKLRTLRLALELRGQTIDQLLHGDDQSSYAFLRERGFSARIIDLFFRPFYGGVLLDRTKAG